MAGASHPCYSSSTHFRFHDDTHTKVGVAATFLQKMSPVWAHFTKLPPAVPSGTNQVKNVKCCLRRGDKECPLHVHNRTKALTIYLHKDQETGWRLVVDVGSRSAQAKSQRPEELVEASGSTPQLMGRGPGPTHRNFKVSRPGPSHFHNSRPGPAWLIMFSKYSARPGPSQFSDWPGPAHDKH